jgi:hypothetical protein
MLGDLKKPNDRFNDDYYRQMNGSLVKTLKDSVRIIRFSINAVDLLKLNYTYNRSGYFRGPLS